MPHNDSVPIVLFVFNRPDKTQVVLEALHNQTVHVPKLIIFADGGRTNDDALNVASVRNLIRTIDWTEAELREREWNFGCAPNIIKGLTEVFEHHTRALILEDDTLPASSWYESLCVLLDHYSDESRVFAVGGYPSIRADALPDYPYDVILSPRFSCWGWGTWADRWHDVVTSLADFQNPFGAINSVPTYAGADIKEAARLVDSRPGFYWDIPLALICLHHGFLQAITRHYLISNIGADGSGTHGAISSDEARFLQEHNRVAEKIPRYLPPAELRHDVCLAVQNYVATCSARQESVHRSEYLIPENTASFLRKMPSILGVWMSLPMIRIRSSLVCFSLPFRIYLSQRFRGVFPGFYSTLDYPSEIPVQVAAYDLATANYLRPGDSVLDVGFGLGYGLRIMSAKARRLTGLEIDRRALARARRSLRIPGLTELRHYDGYSIPYPDDSFDVATCIDVLEHVSDYRRFLKDLCRVARRSVVISTPNRRPEYTRPDGTPMNPWHIREWSHEELAQELQHLSLQVEWNFLDGPWDGPFTVSQKPQTDTLALTPALLVQPGSAAIR